MKKLIALILVFVLIPVMPCVLADEELIIPDGTTLECYSVEEIKAVAKRLYDYTNPDTETTNDIRRAYEQGDYLGCLILYRKLVIDRFRQSVADMDGSLLRYYYSWDTYYWWADVMAGYMSMDDRLVAMGLEPGSGTTKDVHNMLGFPDIDKPSHVQWLTNEHEELMAGGKLDLMTLTNLSNRVAHTGDFIYVKKLFQYLEDYADNLPVQNIEHFGWGDTPLLERSFQKANVTLEEHQATGRSGDYYYALAPQDIGARKLSYILQKANQEMYIFYSMSIALKALPRKNAEHNYGMEYPRTLYETSYTDELADESYDIVDPVRLTKIMLFMLEYALPVLGETMANYGSVPSANIGVSAYGAVARMAALLKDFDIAMEYADRLLPDMNKIFEETQFKDGGFMESHFNYNEGEAANKRTLYYSIIGIAPEFKKYLKRDLGEDATNWDLLVEGYSGVLLPNVGNYNNYGTSEIWKRVPEMELQQGKKSQDYTSVYYPYSGFVAQRNGWLYDSFHMSAMTKNQRYSGHKMAQTNAILNLQAYGRQLILNGGMPFYGQSYVSQFPEFLENGYKEINSYMDERSTKKASTVIVNGKSQTTEYYDFDDSGILKDGQNEYGRVENAFNEQIYDARWLSDDSFDFAEGVYNSGWTVWDYNKEDVYFPDVSELELKEAVTKDAEHNRQFIYVKDAGIWIVLDKLTNTHNQANEYSCMWHFPAASELEWRTTGFENEEVEIHQEENLVRTNDINGPNLYIYSFADKPLTYEKYYGFWEKDNREAYGWSVMGHNKPEYGNKYTQRPEVHVKWKDEKKGDITRLATVLAPSKNTDNPILSKKNLSDGEVSGFELETSNGAKVCFYSSDNVQKYKIGNININAKEVVFVEKNEQIKILALDSSYAERNNVSLNYMLDDNYSITFDKNETVTRVTNFGIPETFAWIGDKTAAGEHKPVYTYADMNKEYKPTKRITDVYSHWSRYYVLMLEERGIFDETESFNPDNAVTRADFAKWLVRASGEDLAEYSECFDDVAVNSAYSRYIQTAYNLGWVEGDGSKFNPNAYLNREEMAKILNKVLEYKNIEIKHTEEKFNDMNEISDWAKPYVEVCLANGIVSGDENAEFNPKNNFTKAEAAKVMAKIFFEAY